MMAEFTDTVAALLAGRSVRAALLIVITWGDGQVTRLWTGDGDIILGGNQYNGGGRIVSIEGLGGQVGTTAPTATFQLSGVDAAIATLAVAERDLAVDAEVACSVQVFGDGELVGEWQPVGDPIGIGAWLGDQLTFDRSSAKSTITLTAVSFFATRSRNLSSYYSDADQRRRYAEDRGAEFMASLQNAKINFPFQGA